MKRKKRVLKKQVLIIPLFVLILIFSVVSVVRYVQYRGSDLYQLRSLGYSDDEIATIEKDIKDEDYKKFLSLSYHKLNIDLVKQKYFLWDRYDRYLAYYQEHEDMKLKRIISIVNANSDMEYYENTEKTDTSKGNLMLVNKHYYLDKNFKQDDIVDIALQYAYSNNSIKKEVYMAFKDMWKAASNEGLKLIVTSSYRDYEWQETLHESYADQRGLAWADSVSARAGYSEHQTGLTLDIVSPGCSMDEFETTEEFKWLQKNAHKYGFILRYPDGEEDVTGYAYESWHYRYVGVKVAQQVYELGITYDEYYAYYILKK